MYQYSNSLIRKFYSDVDGNAAIGVQATVFVGETSTKASLFESNGTTPKANPVTTDQFGFYSFSLADGDYRIVFSSSQFATLRISVLDGAQIREDFDDLVASNTSFRNEQQAAYDAFVLSQGWDQVGMFAAGFTYTSPNQVGQDVDGNWWRWNGSLPKVVTAGTLPSSDANYKLVGDGVLRSDLADGAAQFPSGQTSQSVTDLVLASTRGLKIKPIYCVLRATVAGEWSVLDDAGHVPVGVASVTTNSIGQVVVNFDESYTKVISVVTGCDETLSKAGFVTGSSVALGSASITIGAPCQVRAVLSTGALVKENWVTASSSISAAGEITITHADRNSVGTNHNMPSVTTYNPSAGAGAPSIDISWSDTQTILTPLVPLSGYAQYSGGAWSLSTDCAGVTTTEIAGAGVRITHPTVTLGFSASPSVSARFGPLVAQQDAFTVTTFDVKFRDFAGVAAAAYSTDMRFTFSRDAKVPSSAPVSGSAIVDLGFLPIDAREFASSVGNIWLVGFMLDED